MAFSLMLRTNYSVPRRQKHKAKLYLLQTHAVVSLAYCSIWLDFFWLASLEQAAVNEGLCVYRSYNALSII